LDDLAQRPEGDPLAIGKRTTLPPGDQPIPGVDPLEQLPDEPALADPWDADERHQLGFALADRTLEGSGQEIELALPSHQWRQADLANIDAESGNCGDGLMNAYGCALAFDRNRLVLAVLDRADGGAPGRVVDQDAVDGRGRLESGGRVHDVAGRHALV